jgi:hypothetical protein
MVDEWKMGTIDTDLVALLIQIVVGTIVVAPMLWLAGRALSGKGKAKFTDAVWIVVLGTVIGAIVNSFVGGLLAAAIMFVVWLALIKHFFDCGWLKAFVIAVLAVIIFIVIAAILAFIGIGVLSLAF